MKKAVIIDIDFTLLDSYIPEMLKEKASKFRDKGGSIWDEFYVNLHLCVKNPWCYILIDKLTLDNELTILFITGRNEKVRKQTEKFLKFSHKVNYELHMRSQYDERTDVEVKKDILEELTKRYDIIFAIDDKEDNCLLFKSYGIAALKVV